MKCKEEGCDETAIGHRCAKHKRERELQKDREANARAAAKLRAKREAGLIPPRKREPKVSPPHPCADCGTKIEGRRILCDTCKKEHRAHSSKHAERVKEDTGIFAQVEPLKKWTPKPKPALLMTDAEQRRIDAAARRSTLLRSGMATFDQGRSLTHEEIAAIEHTVTPIHLIRSEPLAPLTLGNGY